MGMVNKLENIPVILEKKPLMGQEINLMGFAISGVQDFKVSIYLTHLTFDI